MRVGKKLSLVESKKTNSTRSCVVRLENVQSVSESRTLKRTHDEIIKHKTQLVDDKTLKGPLKKRPITRESTPNEPEIKPIEKRKYVRKIQKLDITIEDGEKTPTIAAGRSRRAIKPNPKYASEDLVTPKLIKNVGLIGSPESNKTLTQKIGKQSIADDELDDEEMFGKEGSFDEFDPSHELVGSPLNKSFEEKKSLDSDATDLEEQPAPPIRKRGRPKKNIDSLNKKLVRPLINNKSISLRSSPLTKTSQSQIQRLRKTLSATNVNKKRKVDIDENSDTDDMHHNIVIAQGRFKYNTTLKETGDSIRKGIQNQTLNGNQVVNSKISNEKLLERVEKLSSDVSMKSPQSNIVSSSESKFNQKVNSTLKQKSPIQSPASTKTIEVTEKRKEQQETDTMPTFTIVNINDIINKKGDVLISKTVKHPPVNNNNIQKSNNSMESSIISDSVSLKLKTRTPINIGPEKSDTDRIRNSQIRGNQVMKKPQQTILNHSLFNKTSTPASKLMNTDVREKPAPRILNSMVARKTQPVKPLIANLDDSADEILPISHDEEDIEEDDFDEDEDDILVEEKIIKKKVPLRTVQRTLPTKDPNCTVNNRSINSVRTIQRKITPEKVVISKQGDKIIKKITCFENWYVINMEDNHLEKPKRNIFNVPLITLANLSKEVKLPSKSWTDKVTLYELSSSILSRSPMTIYKGDLSEHNILEEDREKFQPSCVMFRRSVADRGKSRLPYDRAVIFKNKTFFTNIDGKNIKIIGAPTEITTIEEVETLLDIINSLTLQSDLVEPTAPAH